jgi:hypothetical protein
MNPMELMILFYMDLYRMWTIGIFLVFLGTGLNQFFAPRLPSISLSITFAQLVAYPLGCQSSSPCPSLLNTIAY